MPIFRGKNGEVQRSDDDDDLNTRRINRDSGEPPTSRVSPTDADSAESEEPKTRVLFRRPATETAKPVADDAMSDPVVGWLVVVAGPGRGHALQLGYGMNSIGRNQSERVCLNFGDEDVSRNQHAIVTYDPRGRKFYVQHGGGKNLTYLDEKPLLVPAELQGGENLLVGQTTLRFVPLCGEHFDWQDNS
jgi:hypothetical protein